MRILYARASREEAGSANRQNGSMPYQFERTHRLAVLGGGPGGYEAAIAGAQLGAEVTLVERAGVGGSAVLTDVVPSKTLIATAEAAAAVGEAADLGVQFFVRNEAGRATHPEVAVNLSAVNQRLLSLARQQSTDMKSQLVRAGVRIVTGDGRLDGPDRIIASTGEGRQRTDFDEVVADTLVIAVGARPRELPTAQPDGERILTWTQLYTLETVPEHLIVVGSGVTGAEFASAYRALGAAVTLVSSREQVLPGEDADAARVVEDVFTRNGMTVLSRSRAASVENTGDGVVVTLADGRTVEGSHCLMAVGSVPNTEGIGLEEAGVQLAPSGHIRVNRVARTSMPSVYAAGDCSDTLPLASVASMQGRTAVFHAMGDAVTPLELRNVTSNIFTQPEVATVGWSQKQIEEGLAQGEVYKLALASNPRAKMMAIRDGFVKLFARTGSGTVIGGVVVGPKASDLILPIALAVEHRLTVDQLARAFSVYPSLSGSITDAARAMHIVG
jgi:dihydrolipoamide dehydrogenase